MAIEIRQLGPDDAEAAVEVTSSAFLERPDKAGVAALVRETWDPARSWLAWDGARACGTFRSFATEITLPGYARVPAAAVAAVTVLPTHRRRGILTRLAEQEHRAAIERGDLLAILYCSEFGIYGRYGYGPATRFATWTVDVRATQLVPATADEGTVEFAAPSDETKDMIRDVFEAWRPGQVSEIRRRDLGWQFRLGLRPEPWGGGWKGFLVLHRNAAGRVDGFLRYTALSKEEGPLPASEIIVNELVGLDDAAESALWRFVTSMDLVAVVKAEGRSPSDRLPWRVTNARAATLSHVSDGLWVRLLDVRAALAARTYEHESMLVLEVTDPLAPGGSHRLALDATTEGATCTATDRSPDLTLPVAALGSVYLGAHDLRDVVIRTGVEEHTPGTLATAAATFRTAREPWCSTFF
jgi:predicted acetyltransferase